MADSVTVHVEGLRELGEAMRKLSSDIALKYSRQATGAAAQVIKKYAKRDIVDLEAVETGSLRDAVIVKKLPSSETPLTSEHIVTVRGKNKRGRKVRRHQTIAPHAGLVEFGTVNMPARPYLRIAFDRGKEDALNAIVAKLKARLGSL